jgi:antirestriction protein ArdC
VAYKKKASEKKGIQAEMELIEKGVQSLVNSGKWKEFLKFHSAFHNYSFNNVMLIFMQCPNAERVAGYKTWQKLKRQVRKGEKAIKILAPIPFKYEKEVEKEDGGKDTKEVKGITFRAIPVFDVGQTDGEELPSLVNKLKGDTEMYKKALEVVPYPVAEEDIQSGANGYYHLIEKRIAIRKDLDEVHKLKTLIHEWGHGILHDVKKDEVKVAQNVRELEAESVAFIVCHKLGIDTSDYSFGYLTGWGGGEDAVALIKASGERIQKASNQIIEAIFEGEEVKTNNDEQVSA